MILYNETVKIENAIHDEWLKWMRQVHIPKVMNTGQFQSHRVCRLMEQDQTDGITYAIQYFAEGMTEVFTYQSDFEKAHQKEHKEKFEGKFVAFRTLLKVLD